MSSRQSIQQIVSTTPPPQVALGDEWYNPTTNKLYKSLFYNGTVQWSEISILGTVSTSSFAITGNTVFGAQPLDTREYDPYFNKVDVLMHFDGNVNNSAPGGTTATVFNVSNNLSFTTGTFASSIGASGALRIAGVSNNTYVRVGNYGLPDPQMAGDFTIEMWFSYDANEGGSFIYRTLLSRENTSGGGWTFYIYNSQQINFSTYGNSTSFNWNQGLYFTANVWYHIAASRSNGVIRFFVNGILQTTTLSSTEVVGGPWRVGAYPDTANYRWNGRIDELRITRDVARYTTTFIPPTSPFPDANYPTSVAINYPTVSFSSSTGALVVQGGIASRGDLNVAGDIRNWGQIRSNYFYSNDVSSGFNAARARPAFQVKGPTARSGDIYGAVANAGLGYDSSQNYVYISNTDGNIINALFVTGSSSSAGWSSNSSGLWTWPQTSSMSWSDVFMGRDGAAGIIGIRRQTTTPASLYVYNTDGGTAAYTTPTNYERAVLDWSTTAGTLTMGVQAGGTGLGRSIRIVTGNNTGTVTVVPGTASTSTNTGALQVLGGIGVGGNVYIGGSLVATSKSFLIDHPTKPNMSLQYGSLEGPENGVYVRGRLSNVDVIDLPDYWTGLVDENTITAMLTPVGQYQELWVQSITNNQVVVGHTGNGVVDCYYTVYGERKDTGKLIVEFNK